MRLRHVLAATMLAGALPALAQDLNLVTGVAVKDEGGSVVLSVTGTKPPNFTTFSMADPPRFVLDLSEAKFQGVSEDMPINDGTILVVKNLSYGSDQTSIARIMIAFAVDVEPPDVQTQGSTLVVRIVKPAGGAGQQVAQAPAQPTAAEATAAADAAAAQARADAAASAAAAAEAKARADAQARADAEALARAEAERKAADDAARAEAERKAQEETAKEQERLAAEAREREAAAAAAATAAAAAAPAPEPAEPAGSAPAPEPAAEPAAPAQPDPAALAAAEAERKRQEALDKKAEAKRQREEAIAAAKAEAERKKQEALEKKAEAKRLREEAIAAKRAEADRKRQEALEKKAEAKRQREEAIAAAKAEAERKKQEALEKRAEAKRAREESLAATTPSQVRELGFKQLPSASRVYLRTSTAPRFTIQDVGENLIRVEVENARALRRNDMRFLDTSFFASAVAMITPSRRGSTYVLDIKLKQKVPYQQKVEGDMLAIDFERPAGAAAAPPADAGAPVDGLAPEGVPAPADELAPAGDPAPLEPGPGPAR